MTENSTPLALVIDDQDDILEIVALTLKYEGWRVETARNGREGIEAVRRQPPDLILADLMMPEMTGIEFCRKLVEEFKLGDIPVLMISGVNEKAKILNDFWEMPLRHRNFLHKPFGTEELVAAVHGIMPRGAAPTPPPPKPAAPQPAPAAAPPKPLTLPFKPEAGRGYRILIVDDDPDIRTVLKATLGLFHVVEEATNGMEGVEMVDHFGPDIVISDINMPQMNGLEAAAAIRSHPVYGTVPIFFLTGETDSALPRKAYDVGCNLYLRKPLDPIQLLKFIDHFLKETGLQPGQLHTLAGARSAAPKAAPAASRPEPKAAVPAPAPPAPAAPTAVRVLIVDGELEHHDLIRKVLARQVAGSMVELLFAEERSLALGNLARWEPDVLIYNPRTPGMDAVAFGQTVRLSKLGRLPELAFIGEQFFNSEVEYSRVQCNRGPIRIDRGEAELAAKLGETLATARSKAQPKRLSYAQIQAEESERLRQLKTDNERQAKQRDILRQRYANLQTFIDHEMR